MLAVRNTGRGIVTVETAPPTAAAPVVTVTSAGICGSDLHAITRGPSPVVLGHEFGGRLDDGTLVAVQPTRGCGVCQFCLRGDDNLCSRIPEAFHGVSLDGGLAEQVAVHESSVVVVPSSVDPDAVGLVEPIAVALHAINRSAMQPGSRALVIGGGTVGLLCAAVARSRGVDVDISARHPRQQEAASALGAQLQVGRRYDVVVDAAGTDGSFKMAVRVAERGGQVVLVALPWTPLNLTMHHLVKEVDVLPAMYYGHHEGRREFDDAARFLADHPDLPDVLITHRFSLVDAAEAFRIAADRAAGAIKVHLHP